MVLVFPAGFTDRPKRLPLTIFALIIAIAASGLTWLVLLSRHEFSPTTKQLWFETLGYDPAKATWWSAFTSLLIHADFFHAFVNLFGLWLFGWFVEMAMGWRYFVVFALLAHLLALKVQTLFWAWKGQSDPPILVGSSALVAFCAGAFCVRFRDVKVKWQMLRGWQWGKNEITTPIWWLAAFWLACQFALLALHSADKPAVAHISSFLFGVTTAFGLGWHKQAKLDQLKRMAKQAERENRWLEAANFWLQVSQLNSNDVAALLSAVRNFLLGKDWKMAEQTLWKAIERFVWDEMAVQEASQIALSDGAKNLSPEIAFSLAEQLERYRQYNEALALFQIASQKPNFAKAPQALLKATELFWRLGAEDKARQTLHLFWLKYGQTHWRHEASTLAVQFRQRGEKQ